MSVLCSTGAPWLCRSRGRFLGRPGCRRCQGFSDSVALADHAGCDVGSGVGHRDALLQQDVQHHLALLQHCLIRGGAGSSTSGCTRSRIQAPGSPSIRRTRVMWVAGVSAATPKSSALSCQRAPAPLPRGRLPRALLRAARASSLLASRASPGLRQARSTPLGPMYPAPLPAHDLARVLQALQRRAQRAARDS